MNTQTLKIKVPTKAEHRVLARDLKVLATRVKALEEGIKELKKPAVCGDEESTLHLGECEVLSNGPEDWPDLVKASDGTVWHRVSYKPV